MKIQKNLGTADKIVRLLFSLVVIALFFLDLISGPLAAALLSLSIILILTVLFSFCPVYRLAGLSTEKKTASRKRSGAL